MMVVSSATHGRGENQLRFWPPSRTAFPPRLGPPRMAAFFVGGGFRTPQMTVGLIAGRGGQFGRASIAIWSSAISSRGTAAASF